MQNKKNVLLITMDQWNGHFLGCAGNDSVMTPTLDEISRYGIRFENAYSPTPVCIPARRELMTGTCARTHGDRTFNETLGMPSLPTMAQIFRDNGYQTNAVGKMHVHPQRDRIGFDDVILNEEGRHCTGMKQDDYERFLSREGHHGEEFGHGMNNNNYMTRPFHLDEKYHPTNWAVREMCETVRRRDPLRPSLWYLSFIGVHPPLAPLECYLDMYRDEEFATSFKGDWNDDEEAPYAYQYYKGFFQLERKRDIVNAKRAYAAMCTHIDHQIRLVIGTLREEGVLDDTIILITADHGEMLGTHGMWGKHLLYEDSVKIPFILSPTGDFDDFELGTVDNRLVELRDVLPTLLEMTGIEIPETVNGSSLLKKQKKEFLYAELWEDDRATRMIRNERFKLIYYAVGNKFQLFDLENDPHELHDLSKNDAFNAVREVLKKELIHRLYGSDLNWIKDGELVGLPDKKYSYLNSFKNNETKNYKNRELLLQRGLR